ncbi:uncharacterized protein LOC103314651 [Tribolium castaneum]|uniref:DUF4773 domain-containing protein n=1 Tax=Tribolium castaneum TaxID=7070 RepID=D6W7K3_TRICA|nr:PREDICTED: uncharacterized protein LOC103314651 [Tribolium castaneum]EFA11304.1 hypothetical protein TcasGA2_TC010841 [Tribolium castaneum]|eukprot:XP_008199376.1 PREDICTED: uncharacterized protein LOC103314651 [Tribolium castaneum]
MQSFVLLCLILLTCGKLSEAGKGNKKVSTSKNTTSVSSSNQATTTTSRPLLPGLRLPCSCVEGQCGCCTGVLLDQFNQKACLNVSYEPDDFSLTAMMSMNGRVLYKRTVSGKNPPPMCIRLPRFQFIRFCVEFSNIYFASRNIHLCIDMEANWEDLTLVEWSFDCIRMGASGVAVVGPEEGGGLPANPVDVVDQTNEDYDDSARNVPPNHRNDTRKLTHCNTLVLDESLKRARPNVDKQLIKIKKLPNGDVVVAYD